MLQTLYKKNYIKAKMFYLAGIQGTISATFYKL